METRLSQDIARKKLSFVPGRSVFTLPQVSRPELVWAVWTFGLVLLIGVGGIAFRILSLQMYSSLPTGFDGPMVFRQKYLIEHHSYLLQPLPIYSYWSGGVNAELGSYLMEFISAVMRQISLWVSLPSRVIHQIFLTPALITVSLTLLLRGQRQSQSALNVAVIAAMITLGTPVVINFLNGWNVAYAWMLLLTITMVYISELPTIWKIGLTTLLTIIGPPLYHSFGFLLVTYVILLWCLSGFTGLRQVVVTPLTVGVYYLIYQIYVSTLFFGTLLRGLKDVLSLDFLRRDTPVVAVSQLMVGSINLQYLHLVVYGLLCIPVAIAAFRFVTYLRQSRVNMAVPGNDAGDMKYLIAITAMSGAITIFALLFGLKFSVEFLINRGASYLIIPAVLAIIYELRNRRKNYAYVYLIAAVAVGISLFSFRVQSTTSHRNTHVTYPEAEGYAWLKARLREQDVVFTDFRLSGPFIADGHFRVLGITGEGKENTKQLLKDIYYESSTDSITSAISRIKTYREQRPADYLFLSSLMGQDWPGLDGYSSRFRPASPRFFSALAASSDWELVYHNSEVFVYHRKDSGGP